MILLGTNLLQSPPVKCHTRGSCGAALRMSTFPIKHLCFGQTAQIISVFQQQCLCFYSDTTKSFPGRVFSTPLIKVLREKGREQNHSSVGCSRTPTPGDGHSPTAPGRSHTCTLTRCHGPSGAQGGSGPPSKAGPGVDHSPAPAIALTPCPCPAAQPLGTCLRSWRCRARLTSP